MKTPKALLVAALLLMTSVIGVGVQSTPAHAACAQGFVDVSEQGDGTACRAVTSYPQAAQAACTGVPPDNLRNCLETATPAAGDMSSNEILEFPEGNNDCDGVGISIDVNCTDTSNPIFSYIGGLVNFLSVGIGVIAAISFIILGFQYMMSAGDPQKVQAAKTRAFNIVLAIVMYYFMYAILNFIIPGGL